MVGVVGSSPIVPTNEITDKCEIPHSPESIRYFSRKFPVKQLLREGKVAQFISLHSFQVRIDSMPAIRARRLHSPIRHSSNHIVFDKKQFGRCCRADTKA